MVDADLRVVRAVEVDPGNPESFDRAYEEHFSSIYNYIRYRVYDATAADDLTSITFHKALDRLHSFDSTRSAFGTWLLVIARNTVHDHLRKRKRRHALLLGWFRDRSDSSMPDPESIVVQQEDRDRLLAAITALPARDRDLLGLKYAAGKSHREIAGLTDLSESNVGVIIHRALAKLRLLMQAGEEQS